MTCLHLNVKGLSASSRGSSHEVFSGRWSGEGSHLTPDSQVDDHRWGELMPRLFFTSFHTILMNLLQIKKETHSTSPLKAVLVVISACCGDGSGHRQTRIVTRHHWKKPSRNQENLTWWRLWKTNIISFNNVRAFLTPFNPWVKTLSQGSPETIGKQRYLH